MKAAIPARPFGYAVFRIDHREPPLFCYPFSVERVSARDLTKAEAEAELQRRRREDRASRYELWRDHWIPWDSYTPETWAKEFPNLPPQRVVAAGIPSEEAVSDKESGPTPVPAASEAERKPFTR